jgi:hypothetical protein
MQELYQSLPEECARPPPPVPRANRRHPGVSRRLGSGSIGGCRAAQEAPVAGTASGRSASAQGVTLPLGLNGCCGPALEAECWWMGQPLDRQCWRSRVSIPWMRGHEIR